MPRSSLIAIMILAASVGSARAQTYDDSRVKAVVAKFLGMDPVHINWLRICTLDTGMGPPLIVVDLPDPPGSHDNGVQKGLSLDVASLGLYVQSAMWRRNRPPDRPKCPNPLSLDDTQKMAEALARHTLAPWPPGMRMTFRGANYRGQENPIHDFIWEEYDSAARTGTRVSIGVNPCPPGSIYIFYEYLAPKHSISEVKITKEQAIATAIDILSKRGAVNPHVRENHADLYLSKEWMEQPHWWIGLDYDNRQGGYLQDVLIDAVTGKELKPTW